MMATRGVGAGRLDTLGARIAALLSLALLPLGLITIVQTYRVLDEATQRLDAALLGATVQATRPERGRVQAAIGSAQALAASVPGLLDDLPLCRDLLADFVEDTPDILFAGAPEADGQMRCASSGELVDFSDSPLFQESLERPRLIARATNAGRVTGEPSMLVSVPMFEDGTLLGYITVALRHLPLTAPDTTPDDLRPIEIATFDSTGELVAEPSRVEALSSLLPTNRSLQALAGPGGATFRDTSVEGRELIYTVAPIINDSVYALGIWSPNVLSGPGDLLRWTLPTIVLPVLMWIASLSVAFFAVHRLVIRHIAGLRRRMRLFSRFRRVEAAPEDHALPMELREVTESFITMALTIQREEAELENTIREKDLLLREVYHRVRNNLQLIASMNNMQLRCTKSPETRRALKALQDRIMALASVHGALYHAPALSKVRTDDLVMGLAKQVAEKAAEGIDVAVKAEATEIRLYPDQAVPLSLLTVEAVSNAAKHLGAPADGSRPFIDVRLSAPGGRIELRVENSVGRPIDSELVTGGSGMGLQLIRAFSTQLAADLDIDEDDARYRLVISFRPSDYGKDEASFTQ